VPTPQSHIFSNPVRRSPARCSCRVGVRAIGAALESSNSENGSPAKSIAECITGRATRCDLGRRLPRLISRENGSRNFTAAVSQSE
jgi:hypothetical protein